MGDYQKLRNSDLLRKNYGYTPKKLKFSDKFEALEL